MPSPIRTFVKDYGWIHLGIGLVGNFLFVAGSILFLPQFEPLQPIPVYIFIAGSSLMAVGRLGQFLVEIWRKEEE
ncbi:MAG TPA: YrhK family protein [Paracoccaceae bacterium]|nr:YrhK family protein [Paracoccaceae bacterium]